jgi:hypothetical protein
MPSTRRKRSTSGHRKRALKPCSPEQIRNPKTNRCVKKSGSIGRKILGKSPPKRKPKTKLKRRPKNLRRFTPYERKQILKWEDDYKDVKPKRSSKLYFNSKDEIRSIPSIDKQIRVKLESPTYI